MALTLPLSAAFLGGCASTATAMAPASAPAMMTKGVLTDPKGITLYTFDRDVAGTGRSACDAECSRNWPPLVAPAGARATGEYVIVQRNDGKAQWAFKGKPLYYWPEDQEPGDRFGDGYNNLWRVVGPTGPVTVTPAANADGY